MEWFVQLGALLVTFALVIVTRFKYVPNDWSEFELKRRVEAGEAAALYEQQRRPLLATMMGLRAIKMALLVAVLATLLVATHAWWVGLLLTCAYLLLAELAIVKGWFDGVAKAAQQSSEPYYMASAKPSKVIVKHLAPKGEFVTGASVASREELANLIAEDKKVLTAGEKAKLLGALHFGELRIVDAMVARPDIVTVGVSETVGPVLLDRLHKARHNIFVVVKKDLDHIQGLLYMHDVATPDPDIKTVKDALRPNVYYIAGHMPLSTVLVASLQSGRQLFIVVDKDGVTQGLITLRDALVKLLGTTPPDEIYTSTDPKKVKLQG